MHSIRIGNLLLAALLGFGLLTFGRDSVAQGRMPGPIPPADQLVNAASAGKLEEVRQLLQQGVPVDSGNEMGWTPLIAAARSGQEPVVKFLLSKKANVNLPTKSGYTPLMAASEFGSPALIQQLLARKANPNAANAHGTTALMLAAGNKFGDEGSALKCAQLLVKAGANVNAQSKRGVTALQVARERKAQKLVAFLKKAGAKE